MNISHVLCLLKLVPWCAEPHTMWQEFFLGSKTVMEHQTTLNKGEEIKNRMSALNKKTKGLVGQYRYILLLHVTNGKVVNHVQNDVMKYTSAAVIVHL